MKATGNKVTIQFINSRMEILESKGYGKTKWIEFCEKMNENGFSCYLYEAKSTLSKYIAVKYGNKELKVRFSNHKPIKSRELNNDCDFFVGVTNTGVRTTEDAIEFIMENIR